MSFSHKLRYRINLCFHSCISLTPKVKISLLFMIIGLTQGLVSSFGLIFNYIYLSKYLMSPAKATFFDSFLQLPWILRPLWIAISSFLKPFGYNNKPLLIIMSLLGCFSLLTIVLLNNIPTGASMFFLLGLSLSFLNCLVEKIIYEGIQGFPNYQISEYERQKESSRRSNVFFITKYFGKIIGAVFMALYLQESNRDFYLITPILCLILVGLLSFILPEKRNLVSKKSDPLHIEKTVFESNELGLYTLPAGETLRDQEINKPAITIANFSKSVNFMKSPLIYWPVLLIFLSNVTFQSPQTKFYFYTQQLNFEPGFMGVLKLTESVAILLSIFIYHGLLSKVSLKKVYLISQLFTTLLLLGELTLVLGINQNFGISDKSFAFVLTMFLFLVAELKSFSVILLSRWICPNDLETTLLPILISIEDLGNLFSSQLGGITTALLGIRKDNFANLWLLMVFGSLVSLTPLIILRKIDLKKVIEHAETYETPWMKQNIYNDSTIISRSDVSEETLQI